MIQKYIFPVLTIAISLFLLIVSIVNRVPYSTHIGPNTWPNMILSFTLVLGIYDLYRTYRNEKNNPTVTGKTAEEPKDHLIVLISLVVYLLLLPVLGFMVSTFILLAFELWFFGLKNRVYTVIFSLMANAFFIVVFAKILHITLPRGMWIFETLSFYIY